MGFKALTINTAAEEAAHIYAQDDAAIYQSIFGIDGVFNIGNLFSSTVLSNNKVRLSDGVLNVGGHIGRIEYGDYEDVTIENGTSGYYRNDIIYGKFLTSGDTDSFSIAVKKGTATTGTASDPALTQGNVYQGDVERDYPLYRVKLSGLSITEVEALFDIVPTIPDLLEKCNDLEDANTALNSSLTNGSVTKIGTETVGSTGVPIYLLNGVPTKASGIVNNLNNKPDWITGTINVTIKGNTDTTVIISPNISYDEIANMSGYIQGYLVSADWSTELIVKYIHGNPTTKKWTVYLRTNGDTEQTYTLHYCLSYTHS